MSEESLINDWVDRDRVRNLAEGLLKPSEGRADQADLTFDDGFVGFAETGMNSGGSEEERSSVGGEDRDGIRFGQRSAEQSAAITSAANSGVAASEPPTEEPTLLPTGVRAPLPISKPLVTTAAYAPAEEAPATASPFSISAEGKESAEVATEPSEHHHKTAAPKMVESPFSFAAVELDADARSALPKSL